jgi:hypothetical protein
MTLANVCLQAFVLTEFCAINSSVRQLDKVVGENSAHLLDRVQMIVLNMNMQSRLMKIRWKVHHTHEMYSGRILTFESL